MIDTQKQVVKFWNENKNLMCLLFSRWCDEKEYEDINDYGEVLRPKVEGIGGEFVKMLKRPFGFNFKMGDGSKYRISINSTNYTYKRMK